MNRRKAKKNAGSKQISRKNSVDMPNSGIGKLSRMNSKTENIGRISR